jgi:hypothetical protein
MHRALGRRLSLEIDHPCRKRLTVVALVVVEEVALNTVAIFSSASSPPAKVAMTNAVRAVVSADCDGFVDLGRCPAFSQRSNSQVTALEPDRAHPGTRIIAITSRAGH